MTAKDTPVTVTTVPRLPTERLQYIAWEAPEDEFPDDVWEAANDELARRENWQDEQDQYPHDEHVGLDDPMDPALS